MTERLKEIIKYHSESHFVDFKAQQYQLGKHPKKNEFLKDISSMANHPSNEPKYIFIGIEEKNGKASGFNDVVELIDQAKYQQFLDEYIEPKVHFEYLSFEYENHKLAVFIINGNNQRPYLFKRNAKRVTYQAIEFRIGDGYIRAGTSTNKLNRKDFEDIYTSRVKLPDRRSDLKLIPIVKKFNHKNLSKDSSYYVIDLMVENKSTKSIGFDIDLKVYHMEGIVLQKRFELEKYLDKEKQDSINSIYSFTPRVDHTILDINIEEKFDAFKISRIKGRNEEYAVKIAQNDKEEFIFLEEILIYKRKHKCGDDCNVNAEITIRCDEFIDGPLIENLPLELKD